MATRLATAAVTAWLFAAAPHAAGHERLDQTGRYEVRWWTVDDGLPESPLVGIAAAADGTLVCGSRSRIVRFDGLRFSPWRHEITAALHAVIGDFWALGFDGESRLWVQGREAVACLEGNPDGPRVRWRVHRLGDGPITGLTFTPDGNPVCIGRNAVFVHRGGRFSPIVVTAPQGGTWQFGGIDPYGGDLWLWQGEGSAAVLRVASPVFGTDVWAADRVDAPCPVATIGFGPHGPWALLTDAVANHRPHGWERIVAADGAGESRRRGKVTESATGVLWVSSHDVIAAFRDGMPEATIEAIPGFSQYTHRLLTTPDGTLWATCSGGLLAARRTGMTMTAVPRCTAACQRPDGSLLVGSPGAVAAVRRHPDGAPALQPIAALPPQAVPTCLVETNDGHIWVGTQDAFVFRVADGRVEQITHPATEAFRELRSTAALACDQRGRVWAGTANGLALYDPAVGNFELVAGHGMQAPVRIIGLAAEQDGSLLVAGVGRGIDRMSPDGRSTRLVRWHSMPGARWTVFHRDSQDTLWIGGDRGLLRMPRSGPAFLLSRDRGLVDDGVRQIDEDAHGRLWVALRDGRIQGMRLADLAALAAGRRSHVRGVVVDAGAGLEAAACIGLSARPLGAVPASAGLVLPLDKGVAWFQPPETVQAARPPTITMSRDQSNGRTLFTVVSPGMHLEGPPVHQIRLRGVDTAWSAPTHEQTKEYDAPSPGHYGFEARRVAGETDADFPTAFLPVDFPPSWWRRPSVVALAAAALVILAAWLSRQVAAIRTRRVIAQLELQRERDRDRARIARDIHDSLGAGLTRMALMTENARRSGQTGDALHSRLDAIYRDAHDLTRSVDEIVWAVNPVNDTLGEFVSFTMQDVEDFARAANLDLRLDVPTDLPEVRIESAVRHHLCLAVREAVQNVLRHARATRLEFTVQLQEDDLLVGIADDGCGFEPDRQPRNGADGLRNMQSRLQDVHGTCAIDSAAGRGTRVMLQVPLNALSTAVGKEKR